MTKGELLYELFPELSPNTDNPVDRWNSLSVYHKSQCERAARLFLATVAAATEEQQ